MASVVEMPESLMTGPNVGLLVSSDTGTIKDMICYRPNLSTGARPNVSTFRVCQSVDVGKGNIWGVRNVMCKNSGVGRTL